MGFNFREAVGLSRHHRRAEYRDPLGLASLTALGLVLELLIVEEKLFPGGENELTATVDALQHLVLKLHLRLAPFARFHRPHAARMTPVVRRNRVVDLPLEFPHGLGPPRSGQNVGTQRSLMPEKRYEYE